MALPKITSAFLNLTNTCNLACKYCFVEQKAEHMPYKVAKDAADFLARNAGEAEVPTINFFGGEPLLRWDEVIVPLTRYIRTKYGHAFNLSMTSNCVLLDEAKARFMVENSIGLLFSIDGDKKTQDKNRPCRTGDGSFDILFPKFDMILNYFPNVMFRSTVTEDSQDDLFDNMLFAERHGFTSVFTMPNCFEDWTRTDGLSTELRKYSDHYIEMMRSGRDPIFFTQMEKSFRRILLYNRTLERGGCRDSLSCKACGKCGLGSGKGAGIGIGGEITACQEFFSRNGDPFYIGNIYTGVRDDLRQALIDEYDSRPATGDDCSTCPLNLICDGGCVANNYMIGGSVHTVPKIYCEWDRLLFREATYIMTVLGEEENERFKQRWNSYVR